MKIYWFQLLAFLLLLLFLLNGIWLQSIFASKLSCSFAQSQTQCAQSPCTSLCATSCRINVSTAKAFSWLKVDLVAIASKVQLLHFLPVTFILLPLFHFFNSNYRFPLTKPPKVVI